MYSVIFLTSMTFYSPSILGLPAREFVYSCNTNFTHYEYNSTIKMSLFYLFVPAEGLFFFSYQMHYCLLFYVYVWQHIKTESDILNLNS